MIASPYRRLARSRHGVRGAVAVATAVAVAMWLRRVRPVFRVEVEGTSMFPGLAPGDRLLGVRLPALEVGDIVALWDPDEPSRILVKRVKRLHAREIEVAGDNAAASRDSSVFGPVPRRHVLGRVVYRYHPPGAVRRFRRV